MKITEHTYTIDQYNIYIYIYIYLYLQTNKQNKKLKTLIKHLLQSNSCNSSIQFKFHITNSSVYWTEGLF